MRVFFTDQFVLPLPDTHRFPMQKYALLARRVSDSGLVAAADQQVPCAASDADILRAHTADYLARVKHGDLTAKEIRRIGFPWSLELVARERRSCGGTIEACRAALVDGVAVNLAGGTHHAFADHGEGFCIFNDSAIAIRALQADGSIRRAVVLDCDVHQGNGTAAILANDPSAFVFSIHGAKNFPFHKELSDLDVELDDGTADDAYLSALEGGVRYALANAHADVAIYLAGADPYVGDTLGRLAVSKAGLVARDRLVLECCRTAGLPVAITMAGGYAKNVQDIVDIHFATVQTAAELFG